VGLTVYLGTTMIANIYGIFICVAGVVGIVWIIWMMRNGDKDRHAEDHARTFFDEHGHWPDETLEEAEAERARLAAASGAPVPGVAQASPDGVV
jgi:hypothetical protein